MSTSKSTKIRTHSPGQIVQFRIVPGTMSVSCDTHIEDKKRTGGANGNEIQWKQD